MRPIAWTFGALSGLLYPFFFLLFCFFAASMLSTRFGYFRPARFADAFAFALLFALRLVCPLFSGADFSQGSFSDFFAMPKSSLECRLWTLEIRFAVRRRSPDLFVMIRKVLLATLVFSIVCSGDASAPERRVEGNVITSLREPKVRIELPKAAQYVGADRFVLYEIADCELHVFVEADAQKKVQRLYWVQFEGYLPSKPELKHTYDSPRHAQIGGLDFYVDTSISTRDSKSKNGSDGEHVRALLRAKGYLRPESMASVRLVHLLDESKRQELMIIYAEDLGPTGLAAADLQENGPAHGQWPKIEESAIERATRALKLEGL